MDEAESKILNAARKDVDLTALRAQMDAVNQQLLAENNALHKQLLRKL